MERPPSGSMSSISPFAGNPSGVPDASAAPIRLRCGARPSARRHILILAIRAYDSAGLHGRRGRTQLSPTATRDARTPSATSAAPITASSARRMRGRRSARPARATAAL